MKRGKCRTAALLLCAGLALGQVEAGSVLASETVYGPSPVSEEELYRAGVLNRYEEYLKGYYNPWLLEDDSMLYYCSWADEIESSNGAEKAILWATHELTGKKLDEDAYSTYLATLLAMVEKGMNDTIAAQASYTAKMGIGDGLKAGGKATISTLLGTDTLSSLKGALKFTEGMIDELDILNKDIRTDEQAVLMAAAAASYDQKRIILEAIRDYAADEELKKAAENYLNVNAWLLCSRAEYALDTTKNSVATSLKTVGVPDTGDITEFLGTTAAKELAPYIKKKVGENAGKAVAAAGKFTAAVPSVFAGFAIGGGIMSMFCGDDIELFREMKAMDEIGNALNRAFQSRVAGISSMTASISQTQGGTSAIPGMGEKNVPEGGFTDTALTEEQRYESIRKVVALGQGLVYTRLRGEYCGVESLRGKKNAPEDLDGIFDQAVEYLTGHYAALCRIFPKLEMQVIVTEKSAAKTVYWQGSQELFNCSIARPIIEIPDMPEVAKKINDSQTWIDIYQNIQKFCGEMEQECVSMAAERGEAGDYPSAYSVWLADTYSTAGAVSFQMIESSYYSGAAHPLSANFCATFDLAEGKELSLGDIINPDNGQAREKLISLFTGKLGELTNGYISDPEIPIRAVFNGERETVIWRFSREGLAIAFSPYEVGPYAAGFVEVRLSYDEVEGLIAEKYMPHDRLGEEADGICSVYQQADVAERDFPKQHGTKTQLGMATDGRAYDVYGAQAYNNDGYRGEIYFYTNIMEAGELFWLPEEEYGYQLESSVRQLDRDEESIIKVYACLGETGLTQETIN